MAEELPYEDCGTYKAASRHTRRGVPLCDPCKAANRDYMRAYRDAHPEFRAKGREENRARWRALMRLARAHPEEYLDLFKQEKAQPRKEIEP